MNIKNTIGFVISLLLAAAFGAYSWMVTSSGIVDMWGYKVAGRGIVTAVIITTWLTLPALVFYAVWVLTRFMRHRDKINASS